MVFIIISSQPMENLTDFPSERRLSLVLKVERNFSSSSVTSCIKIGAWSKGGYGFSKDLESSSPCKLI